MSIVDVLKEIRQTNVTKTIHTKPYDAISLSRPELNQSGKTVLITGGGTGIGLAIAKAFIGASAATVIIVGRRAAVLDTARAELENEARSTGTGTKIVTRTCDVANMSEVNNLWQYFSDEGILVDVYVANAAVFEDPSTMMDLGADRVWEMMEINAKSCVYFSEKLYRQPGDRPKVYCVLLINESEWLTVPQFIINVTTANIHATEHPAVAPRAVYTLSKFAGTLFFQYFAQDIPANKVQVISFHPGIVYNDYWKSMELDPKHFDDGKSHISCTFSFEITLLTPR
jgi:NAD(P)-dependent dehydrogenase (short-subunit alcohol dehydrogenase family)